MATVRPFNGVTYDKSVVGDLDCVVTPPYDVISPEAREAYYRKSPYSVIRLILPEGEAEAKYKSAADTLQQWMEAGVLTRDGKPCFYISEQEFQAYGETKKRVGLACAVRLEDYDKKTVMPHENTLAKPREDRLNILRATRTNLDSVFGLYSGAEVQKILAQRVAEAPEAVATDADGVVCRFWRISDEETVRKIEEALASEAILIADGHHRYAAALEFRNEMRAAASSPDPEAAYEYVMMTLVAFEDQGLVVFPTHRLVRNIEGLDPQAFLGRLSELFDVTETEAASLTQTVESLGDERTAFGLYIAGKAYTVQLKQGVKPEQEIQTPGSDALKRLDVSVLHSMILDGILGIDLERLSTQTNLSYTRDPEGAMAGVDSGEYQMLFVMNPTKVDEVKAVAAAGDKMPQKSTYFYPKQLTGLIMRVM